MRDEIVEVESAEAGSAVVIITQPQSAKVAIGETVTFTVEAENVKSYRWQYSTNKGATWVNSSNTTNTMSYTVTDSNKTMLRRCELTGLDGAIVYTDEVGVELTSFTVDNVTYQIIENTEDVTIVAYDGNATTLSIPETINGYRVTRVGPSAFEGNTTIESIDLPDSIVIICSRAFAGCSKLREMK